MRDSTGINDANISTGRAPRIPVNLVVQLVGNSSGSAVLVNVAHGGVFVSTNMPAEVGSAIHLEFRMLKARVCEAVGTVVWKRAANDEQPGFGVAFVETNKNMESFVRNISSLPEKLRAIYLADVLDPRIELGVSTGELQTAGLAEEVA